jgi:trehalose 6-phosphate synthase/phosphatase
LPVEVQRVQIANMQATVKKYNIHHWVKIFMNRLSFIKEKQNSLITTLLRGETQQKLIAEYKKADQRLIFLDYDGTLMPFSKDPQSVKPDEQLLKLLRKLASDQKNRVVIISGRDHKALDEWLGQLPIDMIGEHGFWLRKNKANWEMSQNLKNDWKEEIRPVLETYVSRTPGAQLEEKDYALVWHYRRVDPALGETRAGELSTHLNYLIANQNLQVMEGDKIVEIKNSEVNKGIAAARWLEEFNSNFVLAIGDDRTDEDTFEAMPDYAYTIKVGSNRSAAKYHLNAHTGVRSLLAALIEE